MSGWTKVMSWLALLAGVAAAELSGHAADHASKDPELKRFYRRKLMQKGMRIAAAHEGP